MPPKINFVTIVDEGGIEIFSFPYKYNLDSVGSALVATMELLSRRNLEILEKIYLEDQAIYIRKLKENYTMIIGLRNLKESTSDLEVEWFINYLVDEIYRVLPEGNILFIDQVVDVLEPIVSDSVDFFEDISEQMEKLNKAYKLAKDIIGVKADDILSACAKDIVDFIMVDDRIYIKRIHSNLKTVLNTIINCKEAYKEYMKKHL